MPKFEDITGKTFGHLTAINRVKDYISPKGYVRTQFLFRCSCGKEIIRTTNLVKRGECCSCGCENSKRIKIFNSLTKTTHGQRHTRLYRIWNSIKTRCFNTKDPSYRLYGQRGITFHKEWEEFMNFKVWASQNGYDDHLTIDRINNNEGYYPENCRWITMKDQSRNKRNNLLLTYKGITKCLSAWAEEFNFDPRLERHRILNNSSYFNKLIERKQKCQTLAV